MEFFPDIVKQTKSSDYDLFKQELWKNINASVRTVIVVQCQFGLSFIRDLYNGLNTPTNIKRIFILLPPDNNQVEVRGYDEKEVTDLIDNIKKVVVSKNVPGIHWEGEPIQKNDPDGDKFKEEDSFIVDVNKFL